MDHDEIKRAINVLGGSQRVAKMIGKHFSAVYRWEKGQTMPDKANCEMLKRLAAEYGR